MEFAINDEDAQKFLKKKIEKVAKIKGTDPKYVKVLSAVVFQDIMDHFKNEAGSEGPWKAWSKVYADHMAKIGKGGNKILQDTGRMRGAFQPTDSKTSSQGILWFNPAKTKTGFPYAAAHQEGGSKLPQRDFMWLSDLAKENIAEQTLRFLEDED